MSLAQVLLGAAARTKVSPRFAPFFSQAANEALVRFGPQWDLLNQTREASAQQMRQRIAQANIAGAMMADAANRSASTLANAPAPSVSFAGPPTSSSAVVAQNLGQTRENTLGMLTTAARNAPVFSAQQALQARAAHEQDLSKIEGSRASLAQQIGAYTTGRVNDLVGSDRKLRHDAHQTQLKLDQELTLANQRDTTIRRGQTLSHEDRQASVEQRRQAAANKPGKAGDVFQQKYGIKPAPQSKVENATNEIGRAITLAKTYKQHGQERTVAGQGLLQGSPSFKDPQTKQPVPAVPAVKQLFAQAALDVVYLGYVTAGTANRLHHAGYSVNDLGLPGTNRKPRPSVSTGMGGSLPLPPGAQS